MERGPLKGRDQEWNLSRKELAELVAEGLLSSSQADECVASEFNPVRAGFYGGDDIWTENVLNIGVRPDRIIAKVRCGHCILLMHGNVVLEGALVSSLLL